MNRIWEDLRAANMDRQRKWDTANIIDLDWRMNELLGEAGEVCNLLKKLDREYAELPGSRASQAQLGEELADVVICADLLLMTLKQPAIEKWAHPSVAPPGPSQMARLGIKLMTYLVRAADALERRDDEGVSFELERVLYVVGCIAYNFRNPVVSNPLDLPVAISKKFNKTSHTVGLPVFLDLDGLLRSRGKDPMYA